MNISEGLDMNISEGLHMNILRFVCAMVLAAPALAGAQGKTEATLRLDWVPGAHHVGPVLAAQRGYYAQEGIDLAVKPGRGSGSTVQVVASGTELFGFADAGVMAIAASKGAPVVMVANFMQVGPNGAITLDKPMSSPKELAGKTIGLVPGESAHVALLAVAKKHGIPESALRIVSIEAASKAAALLTKKVDTIVGFRFGDYLRVYTQNPNAKITLFADWGVNVLGNGYFVSTSTLEKNPDLVQRFVRATSRGWQEARKEPNAAIDAMMKAFPDTNRRFLELGLPMVFEHMQSPAAKGKPPGWTAEEDWKTTLEVMKSAGLEGDRPPSSYYRNIVAQ
jgi:NitT/TauT family transport system substrate-binding protein